MQYSTGKHCVIYHHYHIVWSTKYRYKVLTGPLRLRVRDICHQVCCENEVAILRGVLSSDHVHMFVSMPPKIAISDLVRKMKGRSAHKVQREFPSIRKRGIAGFWAGGVLQPSTAPSRKTSYFSILIITSLILPAPADSRSVGSPSLESNDPTALCESTIERAHTRFYKLKESAELWVPEVKQ
ncbi:IS200/IS605 family transposase [Sulfitobacter sp. 915]|uniref:IS200/IS605 family transposase n=1 Tax=Sulfitobacter sp. 915 TaxID=3368558 RepID=UPI0037471EE0